MAEQPSRAEETLGGTVVHGLPFPTETDAASLAALKKMTPIRVEQEYRIQYLHSYGQDSPWFAALTNQRLLACREAVSGYTYATPRAEDMYTGRETEWVDITDRPARVHAFTVCHFGSEEFLPETPFALALIEFEGVNTLLLTRLLGVALDQASLDWIGMKVTPRFRRNAKLKPTDVYFVPA
jgi:uncharacterized OB-fold protein